MQSTKCEASWSGAEFNPSSYRKQIEKEQVKKTYTQKHPDTERRRPSVAEQTAFAALFVWINAINIVAELEAYVYRHLKRFLQNFVFDSVIMGSSSWISKRTDLSYNKVVDYVSAVDPIYVGTISMCFVTGFLTRMLVRRLGQPEESLEPAIHPDDLGRPTPEEIHEAIEQALKDIEPAIHLEDLSRSKVEEICEAVRQWGRKNGRSEEHIQCYLDAIFSAYSNAGEEDAAAIGRRIICNTTVLSFDKEQQNTANEDLQADNLRRSNRPRKAPSRFDDIVW